METITSREVHIIHEDLHTEPANGIQAFEISNEIRGEFSTNQHINSIDQNVLSTSQNSEETIDLISADLLDEELTDLIGVAKKSLLRQSHVCEDDSFLLNASGDDSIVLGTREISDEENTTKCIQVTKNINFAEGNGFVSSLIEKDIANSFEESNLSSGLEPVSVSCNRLDISSEFSTHAESCKFVEDITGTEKQHPEGVPDLEASSLDFKAPVSDLELSVSDLEAPVSDFKGSSSCGSTDTTSRNSSSEDTSEVEEGFDTEIMRWKKKGDHPEYTKEEFKEEYSRVNSKKTRGKNDDSKRSQKKDKKSAMKVFIKDDEACGMGHEGRIIEDLSNGRNPDLQGATELNNGCSRSSEMQVVGTREVICKSQVSSGDALVIENKEFTRNPDGFQQRMAYSGLGGGFFTAPPKPPRIQSQLSEPEIPSHLQPASNPDQPIVYKRSMSLPVPPPKPRRSGKDGKSDDAENCLLGETGSKNEFHITKGSMGYQNGSDLVNITLNQSTANTQPQFISSPLRRVSSRETEKAEPNEKDCETPNDNAMFSNNSTGVKDKLIRSCATEFHTSPDHPDHQPLREMGNGDVPDGCTGGNVILRRTEQQKRSRRTGKSKDQRNDCVTPTPPIDELELDDGYLRDDITSVPEHVGLHDLTPYTVNGNNLSTAVEVGSDEENFFDGGMHFRGWTWVYIGDDAELNAKIGSEGQDSTDNTRVQAVFKDDTSSISTTASEKEFKNQVKTSKRIKRKGSEIDYHRASMFARERDICLKKKDGVFGFRIQKSRPVVVTEVDKGGAAEEAGIKVGDVILSINGNDVSKATHSDVVKLAACTNENDNLTLVVGTNVCNSLNLGSDQPVMSGYMHKRGGSGLMQSWKKRWFVLKHDNCLYYYKTENDVDPLGAIVLASYTVVKAWDLDKPFAFKLKKFKARTYYLHTTSEDERNNWAFAIVEATKTSLKSDIWMGISTHNVSVPALSITNPECIGYLTKRGDRHKNWKRRFFVLKDACMYYYETNSCPTALGVVHFHGYTIQEISSGSKKFPFDLVPPESDLRTYHFLADHETDRKRWVAALASSIGKWIRTDVCNSDDDEGSEMLI